MKKIMFFVAIAFVFAGCGVATKKDGSTLSLVDAKKRILAIPFIEKIKLPISEIREETHFYTIKSFHPRNPNLTFFVSKDFQSVILGSGFNSDGKPINFPIDMKQYDALASYTIGEGDKEYYLFTDPECPYCKKLEIEMPHLKQGIKIHVFMFPLKFHKNAIAMSKYILSQKNDLEMAKVAHEIATGSEEYKTQTYTPEEDKKMQVIIDKGVNLGRKLGVSGTPTVLSADGQKVSWPTLFLAKNKTIK